MRSDSDFLILFEPISTPITRKNISVTFSDNKYEVPDYLEKEITRHIESIKIQRKNGLSFSMTKWPD